MVAPSGTYAAIVFPLALPCRTVRALLPQWLVDGTGGEPLLPMPAEQLVALGVPRAATGETHLLLVQLGWQAGTGIGPRALGLHFHEFKIDVPYVRHPKRTRPVGAGQANEPAFAYKLSIGFDLRLLQLAGFVAPGPERCIYAGAGAVEGMKRAVRLSKPARADTPTAQAACKGVHPHTSPSLAVYPPNAPSITYTAPGYLSVAFASSPAPDEAGWGAMRTLLTLPWFGGWTGSNAVEFSFDFATAPPADEGPWTAEAPLPPQAYAVSSGVLLPAFLGTRTSVARAAQHTDGSAGPVDVHAGLSVPQGTRAWRFTAAFTGRERAVGSYH